MQVDMRVEVSNPDKSQNEKRSHQLVLILKTGETEIYSLIVKGEDQIIDIPELEVKEDIKRKKSRN